MSFLVTFNWDGIAVDLHQLLQTNPIASPDVQVIGNRRHVALLRSQVGSSSSSEDCTNIAALDGGLWLIGRIRLDARDEVCSIVSGSQTSEADALICLRAYARWGVRCLEYLQGDFCFVLWDEERQRLFCGRDQLGVRPLFYTKRRFSWLVSDTLDLIAAPTALSDDLDDYWIADFLTSGFCRDFDRTVYKRVKRLPPAHFLSADPRGSFIQRYWTLEIPNPIYYRRSRDYIEHFQETLALAIKDRLPQGQVGISMSGGMDSSTLAAHTLKVVGDASKVIAHTRHFEYLIADEEKHFSTLVARKLGIPLTLRAIDDAWYDSEWYRKALRTPEPNAGIVRATPQRMIAAEMTNLAQVWFCGEGPDNALMFEWQPYLKWLFAKADWFRFGEASVQYILSKRPIEWCATVGKWIKPASGNEWRGQLEPPLWLTEGLTKQLRASARQRAESVDNRHPWHPRAIASFRSSIWQHFLERLDPSISGIPLAWRHPYLDLRVLTFLLSVPPIPWGRRKRLIREAMQGLLPKEVISRYKAPLNGDPLAMLLRKNGLPQLELKGPVLQYIDPTRLPKTFSDEQMLQRLVRVYVLASWLRS